MKKLLLILLFFSLNTFAYASFPSNDTLITKQDSLQSETTVQYHQRMESMGFDINLCQCKDCQKFKGGKTSSQTSRTTTRTLINTSLFLVIGILIFTLYLGFQILSWIGFFEIS
ncbi:MAG: hypothetical protein CMD19_00890 [Flavobacteriales bacterium]|nr:hypothetical protein [Flavobacteriales bacterium]|tara:strand:+ start:24 stop:365 length:342 start_codon:yes stop_codon:yes gene_type:complete